MSGSLVRRIATISFGVAAMACSVVGALGVQAPAADPKTIWPAGLEKIAGRYVFLQVASPGGLWEHWYPVNPDAEVTEKQVSINEVPAELRDKLTRAEITISELKLPSDVDATERESPTRRGRLRYYSESAIGKLVMRNLPGIGVREGDTGDYNGRVLWGIDHQSHSNPSVSGVLLQRLNQEPTWGVATLDYADLEALALLPGDEPDLDDVIIGNARILRSGIEIFAFIEWEQTDATGRRSIHGCLRLARTDALRRSAPIAVTQR